MPLVSQRLVLIARKNAGQMYRAFSITVSSILMSFIVTSQLYLCDELCWAKFWEAMVYLLWQHNSWISTNR